MSESQLPKISAAALRKAATIREKIEQLEQEYQELLGSADASTPARRGRKPGPKPGRKKPGPKPGSKKKRPHSAETRQKIADAAKARWAKKKANKK